jgi:pimeloyl-ACP methyl ester carboxylesterase
MLPPADAVETAGSGPELVLIHGTGMDGASLLPLARLLGDRLRVTRYHRRGTSRWPGPHESAPSSAEEHADDLAELVSGLGGGAPVHLFGASFGGVVALELVRRRPDLVRSAALFEPAAAGAGEVPAAAASLLASFERWIGRGEPERAAELFHRRLLSEVLWRRLEPQAQARARGQWRHIPATWPTSPSDAACGAKRRCQPRFAAAARLRSSKPPCAPRSARPRARCAMIEPAGHQSFGRPGRNSQRRWPVALGCSQRFVVDLLRRFRGSVSWKT